MQKNSPGRFSLSPKRGRGAQINFGVAQASSDIVCVLHADSILPVDAVNVIRKAMTEQVLALRFTPRIAGPNGTRRSNRTQLAQNLVYPVTDAASSIFQRRAWLLFGDHAMFFQTRGQFLAVGGCDETIVIMEEADLCIKLASLGRTKMNARWVWTSDRRITAWGRWRANWIYVKVGMMWAMGARKRLADHYPDIR